MKRKRRIMSNIISKTDGQKYYDAHVWYNRKRAICCCGVIIYNENVVVAEVEKNINGADVPTLEFFCSEQCAHEWLDDVETKKQIA